MIFYRLYLHYLDKLAWRCRCTLHACLLMTNHVHLLLTPAQENSASLLMKHLGQRYVQYINRSYPRSGTLWEGRFRSCLTQSENYVLACYRYIELNPVRAGMVHQPEDYRWSSFRSNGLGKHDPLVQPHEQYLRLAATYTAMHAAYRALFDAHLEPKIVVAILRSTNGNFALGGDRFKQQIEQTLGWSVALGVSGRPRAVKKENAV